MAKSGTGRLTRSAWTNEAKKLLISHGISEVKVEVLAKRLGVTPGSFYHHFSGRPDLHDSLLKLWQNTNTAPLRDAIDCAPGDPKRQYLAFFAVWVLEEDFDPKFDLAVRNWGKTVDVVAQFVKSEDDRRIAFLKTIFEGLGYENLKAEMRARVTYYHQIGYYAIEEEEPRERRLELVPEYAEILTGKPWFTEFSSADEIRKAMKEAKAPSREYV